MYIDKIYTKLYSNKDWNGLRQLVSEIKLFSSKDELRGLKGIYLDEMKKRRAGDFNALSYLRNNPEMLQDYENAYDLAERLEDERRHDAANYRRLQRAKEYPNPDTWEHRKSRDEWRKKYPIGKVARERSQNE